MYFSTFFILMRKEVGYFLTTKGRIKQSLSGYYDVLVEDKDYCSGYEWGDEILWTKLYLRKS